MQGKVESRKPLHGPTLDRMEIQDHSISQHLFNPHGSAVYFRARNGLCQGHQQKVMHCDWVNTAPPSGCSLKHVKKSTDSLLGWFCPTASFRQYHHLRHCGLQNVSWN